MSNHPLWPFDAASMHMCACLGPQGGDELCPCRMQQMASTSSRPITTKERERAMEVLQNIIDSFPDSDSETMSGRALRNQGTRKDHGLTDSDTKGG